MSDMDGTPNPMLEAAAMANALVSTRIGNMSEFIDNAQAFPPGILVERDTSALEAALAWCLVHKTDVLDMGMQARLHVERAWTWERQCEHVRTMWREVLA